MSLVKRTASESDKGMRVDKWLAACGEFSRAQIQQWIKEGLITRKGGRVKASDKVENGDEVVIETSEPDLLGIQPENIPLNIVFEDRDVIVVNKPEGMVVHPAPGHTSGTLVHALLYHCEDLSGINGVMRPGIVHRIDKDTSGLLMIAKNNKAHESLSSQLHAKTIKRTYQAIVHGMIEHDHGTIDAPIGRDRRNRKKMAVTDQNSKEAVTHFTVLQRFSDYTYVECQLETGRTHQIRVHMKYIGHPVVSDPKYGPKKTLYMNGQALHATVLGFHHPRTGEWMIFESPLPEKMQHVLEKLKK